MLKIISGVPGSGKTYWAVHHIWSLHKQYEKDKLSGKDVPKDFPVLHNIEGLKIGTTFDKHEEDTGATVHDLFSYKWHEKHKEYRGYLLVIDEAQSIFRKRYSNTDGFLFFEKHRHLGIDIILLTQDYKLICPDITLHQELHLRAVSDTANPIPFLLMYQKMVGWEAVGREFLRKRKEVFDLYKTADYDQDKTRKKSRPMFYLIIGAVVLAVFGLSLFKSWVSSKSPKNNEDIVFSESKESKPQSEGTFERMKQQMKDAKSIGSSQDNQYEQSYPQSLFDEYQGALVRVSVVELNKKKLIFYGDLILSEDEFPYPIFRSNGGMYISVVPLDVMQYQKNMVQQRKQYDTIDPNQGWYYEESQGKQSRISLPGGS